MSIHTNEVPRSVRIAALLFVAYGVMVLVNALLLQSTAGWENARDFPRALVRLAGCGVIAYALLQRLRWGWWVAVVLGGLWAVTGAAAVLMLTRAGAWDQAAPGSTPVFLVGMAVILGAAVALLLQRASRDAFR
jgi:hypothetical protein